MPKIGDIDGKVDILSRLESLKNQMLTDCGVFLEKSFFVLKVVPKKLLGSCIPLVNLWCIVAFPCQLRVHNGFLSHLSVRTIIS